MLEERGLRLGGVQIVSREKEVREDPPRRREKLDVATLKKFVPVLSEASSGSELDAPNRADDAREPSSPAASSPCPERIR